MKAQVKVSESVRCQMVKEDRQAREPPAEVPDKAVARSQFWRKTRRQCGNEVQTYQGTFPARTALVLCSMCAEELHTGRASLATEGGCKNRSFLVSLLLVWSFEET
jgi:hypothetical protein